MAIAASIAVIIRFTSTLSAEEENAVAAALLKACVSVLGLLPVAYALRIETSNARVYEHSCATPRPMGGDPAPFATNGALQIET